MKSYLLGVLVFIIIISGVLAFVSSATPKTAETLFTYGLILLVLIILSPIFYILGELLRGKL